MPTSSMYRLRTAWTGLPGGAGLTTTYFDAGGGTVQQAVDALGAFWTDLASRIANNGSWDIEAAVAVVDPITGNTTAFVDTSGASGAGSSTGAMLSYGSQGLLNLRTASFIGGRELRGKLYIPVPTVNDNSDGVPSVGYGTAVLAAWDTLWNATGSVPVVYSRTHGLWEDVEARNISSYWARLRSRQR